MGNVLFMRKGETHSKPIVRLPEGYTELEYIESTGTQYIDTGVSVPHATARVVVDFTPTVVTGDHLSITGHTNTTFGWTTNFLFINGSTSTLTLNSVDTKIVASADARYIVDYTSKGYSINGGDLVSTSRTYTDGYNDTIFYSSGKYGQFKLYSYQLYDEDVLVRDFVPCINAAGEIGLYDRVGKKFYGNAGTGVFKCNLDFANVTWEEVITACQTNKVPPIWNVGDQKTMTINGVDYPIDIIGMNHDTYSDGSGTAPLTFQMHDCYGSIYKMNTAETNKGGWADCEVRTTHLPAILKLMPSEVQGGIKEVNKLTATGYGNTTIVTSADKLFLLSEIEVFNTTDNSNGGEGSQYDYYKAGNSTVKNLNETANGWWTRSPWKTSDNYFCVIYPSGSPTGHYADVAYGVAFAFCF